MWSCSCFCTNMLQFFGDNNIMVFLLRTNVQLAKFVEIAHIFFFHFFKFVKLTVKSMLDWNYPQKSVTKTFVSTKLIILEIMGLNHSHGCISLGNIMMLNVK